MDIAVKPTPNQKGIIMKIKAILSILPLVFCAAQAGATTITFDDLTVRNNFDSQGISNTYLGYKWSSSGGFGEGWASATTSSTIAGAMSAPVSGNTIAWSWDGVQSLYIDFDKAMDVTGAWIAQGYAAGSFNASSVTMLGYDANQNLISTSASITPTFDFQHLSASMTGVYRLELRANATQQWFAVDNIEIAPSVSSSKVPEPGSLALIGLGLAGFAAMRRKKA
jgi:hypothetical protein